jgi:hypothetical protein
VKSLAESTEGLEAGWVDNDVPISLLVFAVFVFVAFIRSYPIDGDGWYSHCVRVTACDVYEVVRDMFAAEGDDVEAKIGFSWNRESLDSLFNCSE